MAQDFSIHSDVLVMVEKSQDADREMREQVREAKKFITLRNGMWDPDSWEKMDGRFRGSFDLCTPIVDGIAGEIAQADFTMRVSPSGGDSSVDTAKVIDGLLRNIRNVSNAEAAFTDAARSNVIGGFDCVEVIQEFVDADSFDQDLMVKRVSNAVDSVWFDLSSVEQSRSDANWAVKLVAMPIAEYNERFPDGGGMSIGDNATNKNDRSNKEVVTIGQLYYRKPITIELVMMTDGSVYEDNEDFKSVQDDLAAQEQPIVIAVDDKGEEKRRKRDSWRVWSRMLDGGDWLKKEEETVFDFIPLVPIYGNFDIVENQCIYFGVIENLYDHQRVFNYANSRDIEDGALSPSSTVWMTDEMAEGNDYSRMNTSRDPVQIFNIDKDNPGLLPTYTGGPQPSAGLQTTAANMQQLIGATSNTFSASQGNANPNQSGVAGQQQIEQGNIGTIKWFKPLETMICQVAKVIITGALTRVYGSTRQVRILEDDGTSSMVMLNEPVFDVETQKNVILNDLSIGHYDVVCEAGPAFNSSQKEAVRSFEAMTAVAPEVAAGNIDIWLKNKKEPGFDLMAERERAKLFGAGLIPESQWTDEEKALVQQQQAKAQQQPQQEDPNMVLARAEESKAQADQLNAQTKQSESQLNAQVKIAEVTLEQDKVALEREKLQLDIAKFQREKDDKFNVDAAKIDQGQQKIDLDAQKQAIEAQQKQQQLDLNEQGQQLDAIMKQAKLQQDEQAQFAQQLNDSFANLKIMREAMGVDTIVGPGNTEAYIEQAGIVGDLQGNPSPDVVAVVDVDNGEVGQ